MLVRDPIKECWYMVGCFMEVWTGFYMGEAMARLLIGMLEWKLHFVLLKDLLFCMKKARFRYSKILLFLTHFQLLIWSSQVWYSKFSFSQAMFHEFSTANIQIDKDFSAKLSGYGCISHIPETDIPNGSPVSISFHHTLFLTRGKKQMFG